MARALGNLCAGRLTAVLLATIACGTAEAACVIDNAGEITNPFAAGCGDVMLTYTQNDNTGNNVALGYPVPQPIASLTPVDGFRDYASLFARHQSLLTQHDEVAGQVLGQTVAGRDIWAYVIGDADSTTADGFSEPAVLINGGIHAREWQTPEAVTALFEHLVAGKADHSLTQYLVENLNTVVLPVNNVDGFLSTQAFPDRTSADRDQPREGRMRRKNLRNPQTLAAIDANLATVADNFWGVDLNRNAAQGFGQYSRSSASVTSLVHRGPTAASEPELVALQSAAALGPAARLRLFSDTHSFSQVYLAPTTGNTRRNAITAALANRMRAASERNYGFEPDPADTTGIGTTADHFAFTYQIPSWTLELEPRDGGQEYGGLATHGHSGFILPAAEAARMRADVVRMYVLGFYRQTAPPAAIAAQLRDTATSEIVYDARWQASSSTARTQTVTTNRALVPGRSYRLWVAFNKPMRIRNGAGAVVAYRGQTAAAGVGTVTIEIPSLTGQDVALAANATWLNTAGGAPAGYQRYSDDAFAVDFTLPASVGITTATAAVMTLAVRDLADAALDSNPATAADWSAGHWIRYENVTGEDIDTGGTDCGFRVFIAAQADAAPPATAATCRAAAPPAPPPPPPPSSSGGGGGQLQFATLCVLALLAALRRESFQKLSRTREARFQAPRTRRH